MSTAAKIEKEKERERESEREWTANNDGRCNE